jgi:hypothetical protein
VLLVCTVYSVLYSKIALSRKPFGIGHMYIYIFWLRITDTMISQNIDLSSWNILYIRPHIFQSAEQRLADSSESAKSPVAEPCERDSQI